MAKTHASHPYEIPCPKCGSLAENDPMLPSGSHVCAPQQPTTQPAEATSLSTRLCDLMFADSELFDRLDEVWTDKVNDCSWDWHDNSVEVKFGDVPADFTVTVEDIAKLLPTGFTLFWCNYQDGTMQTAGKGRCGNTCDVWVAPRKLGSSRPCKDVNRSLLKRQRDAAEAQVAALRSLLVRIRDGSDSNGMVRAMVRAALSVTTPTTNADETV